MAREDNRNHKESLGYPPSALEHVEDSSFTLPPLRSLCYHLPRC